MSPHSQRQTSVKDHWDCANCGKTYKTKKDGSPSKHSKKHAANCKKKGEDTDTANECAYILSDVTATVITWNIGWYKPNGEINSQQFLETIVELKPFLVLFQEVGSQYAKILITEYLASHWYQCLTTREMWESKNRLLEFCRNGVQAVSQYSVSNGKNAPIRCNRHCILMTSKSCTVSCSVLNVHLMKKRSKYQTVNNLRANFEAVVGRVVNKHNNYSQNEADREHRAIIGGDFNYPTVLANVEVVDGQNYPVTTPRNNKLDYIIDQRGERRIVPPTSVTRDSNLDHHCVYTRIDVDQ
ncbi:hypothetical protein MIR68_005755 [Amoeboaphelidium protococcarum]|nr:hypothetical protein MIR68_005755 [Amoeboaphelidium protococcarum]